MVIKHTTKMRDEVFALLIGADDYISGEAMSKELGISRAAIWKHIKVLEDEGYNIEAVRNLGYKIVANGIKQAEIEPYLTTEWLGREQEYVVEADSTNDLAKDFAEKGAEAGLAVFADAQKAGRGRLGRPWSSPKGTGIWCSLLLRPKMSPATAPQITLATAVGVANGLRELGFNPGIKWPNDILIDGKKVCGILTEMRSAMDEVYWVVVGIGINALNLEFPEELKDVATSLALNTQSAVSRSQVAGVILNNLEKMYETLENGDFETIRKEWLRQNVTLGKMVQVTTINEQYNARAKAMSPDGHLIVEMANGELKTVVSGYVLFSTNN